MPRWIPSLVTLCLWMPAAIAADYFVAPGGDDGASGLSGAPFATIGHAASVVEPGDTVTIRGGTYRESVYLETDGTAEAPIVFQAAPGERVVVSATELLQDWEDEGGEVYSAPWPHLFINWVDSHTQPNDAEHAVVGRAEQVHVEHYPLLQVLDREHLARGTFYVDLEADRIYIRDRRGRRAEDVRVEASRWYTSWVVKGAHVHTRGIVFRYSASMAQHGGTLFEGDYAVVEDCVFERHNACGARFESEGGVVRRCTFQNNGQMGFAVDRAHGMRMIDCLVRNNSVKDWNRGWEAGGNKIAYTRGMIIERCRFLGNRGNGVWFDIGNEDCVVRNSYIAHNENAGIFYEISYGLHAHDNVLAYNGHDADRGAWGADGGISISSSPDCVVERNILLGNREGIQFREAYRTTPRIDGSEGPVWNHDIVIRKNILSRNHGPQVAGWFDVVDGRHWPEALRPDPESEGGGAPDDNASRYAAMTRDGFPTKLSLADLALTVDQNLYDPPSGGTLLQWGVTWKFHKDYTGLENLREDLGFETNGTAADLPWADAYALDLRLPEGSPAFEKACYPQGDVPGVRLGSFDPE